MTAGQLTVAIISYRKNRINNRLIFGEPVLKIRRDWRREFAAFSPGQVFAYERWRGDKYGTQDWRLFVCAATHGGPVTAVPGVSPGAQILLCAKGKARVKRALNLFDDLKITHGVLEDIPPQRWLRLHNAIETGRVVAAEIT